MNVSEEFLSATAASRGYFTCVCTANIMLAIPNDRNAKLSK